MELLVLFFIFFKIGLFSVGGGLATLPLLYDEMVTGGYVSAQEFVDMVAVSQSTPGPIGVNMATYVGYKVGGLGGSFVATTAMAMPAFVIIILIASFLRNFEENYYVQSLFSVLRGASVGLIAAATWFVFSVSVIDISLFPHAAWFRPEVLILFAGLGTLIFFAKSVHPLFFIVVGALSGLLLF